MSASAREYDINGFYEIQSNPISKVGVFPYSGKSIDYDGAMGLDPDKIYNVYRPKSELADPECIESFKLLPWINEHEMLGSGGLTPAEEKGIEGVIGESVYFDDGDQTLKGNIKVFSESLKESIEYGKQELSCGYRCKYRLESGTFAGESYDVVQGSIRGNHLALVDQGRMGKEVAVLDEMKFTIDAKEFVLTPEEQKAKDMEEAKAKKTADEAAEAEAKKAEDEEFEAKKKAEDEEAVAKKAEDEEGEKKDGEAMDAMIAENKALKSQVDKLQTSMDSFAQDGMKTLMGQISKRDALASKLSAHVGTFDHSEMTIGEVATYGIDKLSLTADSGAELATLNGYLHNRAPATQAHGLDSGGGSNISAIDKYLTGAAA